MDVVHPKCCGLDVHKQTVVACVLVSNPSGQARREVRTFGTMTHELLALSDWLASQGISHVALEATGAYWKPIWNLLEDRFELLLVNAQHIKAVPGRKTDSKTPNGSQICCGMAYSDRASCQIARSASYASSRAIGPR